MIETVSGGGDGSAGARVIEVVPGGVAEATGIEAGDVIVEAAGRPIAKSGDLIATVRQQSPGTWLPLKVQRDGATVDRVARFPPRTRPGRDDPRGLRLRPAGVRHRIGGLGRAAGAGSSRHQAVAGPGPANPSGDRPDDPVRHRPRRRPSRPLAHGLRPRGRRQGRDRPPTRRYGRRRPRRRRDTRNPDRLRGHGAGRRDGKHRSARRDPTCPAAADGCRSSGAAMSPTASR